MTKKKSVVVWNAEHKGDICGWCFVLAFLVGLLVGVIFMGLTWGLT